jgi:hypothetical protein
MRNGDVVVEIFDILTHPELAATQARCIVNRVPGGSGKLFQRIKSMELLV